MKWTIESERPRATMAGVRDYGQYCPIALGSEVVAERWTPLILREMVLGSTRFNDIQRGVPNMSRTLLAKRLRQLEHKGVVRTVPASSGHGNEYELTPAGRELEPVIMALGEWSVRWLFAEPAPRDVDPVTLTWWMHRRVAPENLPPGRVVVQFDYRDERLTRLWLLLDRGEPSVCMVPPGFDPDLVVTADSVSLMRVFSGIDDFDVARARGTVRIDGPRPLARQFPTWFSWSPFADAARRRVATPVDSDPGAPGPTDGTQRAQMPA